MPKTTKPVEFGPDDCLPGGPNGGCARHGYPFYVCAAVAARMRERVEAGGDVMRRKAEIERAYQHACRRVYEYPLGDLRQSHWIGVRDVLAWVLFPQPNKVLDEAAKPTQEEIGR